MTHLWGWWCLYLLVMMSSVMTSLSPVVGAVEGEAETTSPAVTKCWECMNYDVKGNFYDQCPMNGSVDPVRAFLGNCSGKCFTHNDDLNDQLIIRGCTSSQWGLPDPLPADGCYPWYSEVWCVCSTDGCNGLRLGTPTSDQEFDHQVDYSKAAGDPNSTQHVHNVHTVLLCLFCVVITVLSVRW